VLHRRGVLGDTAARLIPRLAESALIA